MKKFTTIFFALLYSTGKLIGQGMAINCLKYKAL